MIAKVKHRQNSTRDKQIDYRTIRTEDAEAMSTLMRVCFPQIGEEDLLLPEEFQHHAQHFPEGQFVAHDGERIVGMGIGLFVDIDFANLPATELALEGGAYFENHSLNADWYYGVGICVHPDYRRHGIGRALYNLRKDLVRRYQKKGIVAAAVLRDYPQNKKRMTAHEYIARVTAGELLDRTLSVQLKNGFQVRQALHGFFHDDAADNWSALIVWENR